MSFKSGCVHETLAVTDQQTALATLQGMKESSKWAGLFDTAKVEVYTVPVDTHNWVLVQHGMKRIDEHGQSHWVTYLIETTQHVDMMGEKYTKEFKRHLEKCTGCPTCDEQGFKKTRIK